jgi:hypothetical protein
LSDPSTSSSGSGSGSGSMLNEGETAVAAAGAHPPYPQVKRDDYVRLLIQALCDLGFKYVIPSTRAQAEASFPPSSSPPPTRSIDQVPNSGSAGS